jgi:uncharacterized membrane protein YbhN (UPF0104 family)
VRWDYRKWAPLFGLAILTLVVTVLWDRIRDIQFGDIMQQIRSLPTPAVIGALACSAGAYLLVGLYEGIALHRVSGQRRMWYAIRTTLIANPVGRAIGVAVVSGGALRYRFYSAIGLNARQVASLIVLMAMPYVLGVGWLIDVSLLFHHEIAGQALRVSASTILLIGSIGLLKDFGWLAVAKWRVEPITVSKLQIRVPNLPHTLLQIALGIAQILCNTGILYLLMPDELAMSWPAFRSATSPLDSAYSKQRCCSCSRTCHPPNSSAPSLLIGRSSRSYPCWSDCCCGPGMKGGSSVVAELVWTCRVRESEVKDVWTCRVR